MSCSGYGEILANDAQPTTLVFEDTCWDYELLQEWEVSLLRLLAMSSQWQR